jgi:hypothetical protein
MIEPGEVDRVFHVVVVPGIRILAAHPVQVGSGPFRAPEERMVVDELAGLRILAVAFGFRSKRPDHLRVATDATLADVDIAAEDLERGVRLHAGDGGDVFLDEVERHDFDEAANTHRHEGQCAEGDRFGFEGPVAPRMRVVADHRIESRGFDFFLGQEPAALGGLIHVDRA